MLYRALGILVAGVLAFPHSSPAQTRQLLDAPLVKQRIRVIWDSVAKGFKYGIDSDLAVEPLTADTLFLAQRRIYITYPEINPLEFQATAAVTLADDPSHATVAKLLEAMLGVASIIRPTATPPITTSQVPAPGAPQCQAVIDAEKLISALDKALYGGITTPKSVNAVVDEARNAVRDGYVNGLSGAAAVNAGIAKFTALIADVDTAVNAADPLLKQLEALVNVTTVPNNDCDAAASALYHAAHLTNPRVRRDQLAGLKTAVTELRTALTDTYVTNAATKWIGTDFIISAPITPTADQLRNVAIRAVRMTFTVDGETSALATKRDETGSVAVVVRKYSRLVPEVGVGAVFAFVPVPKYGTATVDGKTVVARVPDEDFAVEPSILANFVCRCGVGPFITPMLQAGASTSEEVPALLLGGGLRLFSVGKGDVAIGGGWLFAWVKDLQKLHEGDPVGGTKDIEADLGRVERPRTGHYFVFQYKF